MIDRRALFYLKEWKTRHTRKPLVLRGARQVGKTKLAADLFGKNEFESVVEINFEARHEYAEYFRSNDPAKIVALLETTAGKRIIDGNTLLFLDEIQAEPQVLASLRYFYEKRPSLHVIAAWLVDLNGQAANRRSVHVAARGLLRTIRGRKPEMRRT